MASKQQQSAFPDLDKLEGMDWDKLERQPQQENEEKLFQCNHCPHKEWKKYRLFRHIRDVHYSSRCPVLACKQEFRSKEVMKQHLEQDHKDWKFSECDDCGKIMGSGSFPNHSCPAKAAAAMPSF